MKHHRSRLSLAIGVLLLLILTLALASCGNKTVVERNTVTDVTLNGSTLTVKAVLTPSTLTSYKGEKVYLLEIPSCGSDDPAWSTLTPISEANPAAELTFEVAAADGMRSRRYSSFFLAVRNQSDTGYVALTSPVSLSNPEAAATAKVKSAPAVTSIKGLISDRPADAIRLGISHTVVDVRFNEIMLDGYEDGAVPYLVNGVTAYLDGDVVEALDETVRLYTDANVQVYLRFTLTEKNALAIPTADDDAESYAVDMNRAEVAVAMEGFFDFMADRYATPERDTLPVSAFLIGYRTNHASRYANAGSTTMADFVTNYEKLVHVAHIALRSHLSDGRVYISLDAHRSVGDMVGGWDVTGFLSSFRDEAVLRGNYDWHMATELYAQSPAAWEEDAATDSVYYTVRNLGTLTDLVTSDLYRTPDGQNRRLMISGMSIPAVPQGLAASGSNANLQAASYAFSYMTVLYNQNVEALIYDAYTDRYFSSSDGPLSGILSAAQIVGSDERIPADRRPIYYVFRQIDTSEAASLTATLTELIGAPYTKLMSAMAGLTAPTTATTGDASLKAYEADRRGLSPLITFGGGSLGGFGSLSGLVYTELVREAEPFDIVLHSHFERTNTRELYAVKTTLSGAALKAHKELWLDLCPKGTTSTLPTTALTLRLTRAGKGTGSGAEGLLTYESTVKDLTPDTWQTAVFSVEEFTRRLEDTDEITLTLYVDNASDTAYDLHIAGIYAADTDARTAKKGNTALIVVLIVVAVVVVGGVVAALLLNARPRRRR